MENSEKKILIVDDSPNNIELLGATLRNEGYSISFAVTGKQAIELATVSKFDLILLDIMMPEMDGFEVFEILKQNSADRKQNLGDKQQYLGDKMVPVIFCTAKTDNESILKAFSLGAVDYITKPFRSSEVLARVRTQLELADSKTVLIEMNNKLLEEIALRKENEYKLQESEANYRRLVENVPAIVYSVSNSKGRTFVSAKVKNILGYNIENFRNTPFLWRNSVHPEDKEKYLNALSLSMLGYHYDIKYRIKGAQGEWHWLLDRSFGMHAHPEDGTPCIEGIAIDITQQEKMEHELLKLIKLESAGIFAGGIAHDMNNLNCIVSGNIELAKDDLNPGDPVINLLDDAFQAVEKQTRLIQQLATLTQGFKPQKTRGYIGLLIHEVVRHMEKSLQSKIEVCIADDLWTVDFDRNLIKNAFENILINADEAMQGQNTGVIKVNVRNSDFFIKADINNLNSRDPLPYVSTMKDNNVSTMKDNMPIAGKYVMISVKDHGVGIAENEINLIFDPYYSTKNRGTQKGMGLGLTMALAMVKKHGGYIFVNSIAGQGSIFDVYLPSAC